MKRTFLILMLLVAFNFSTPNSQLLSMTARHVIEYTQEDKTRDLTNNEILKNKVVMYMRIQVMLARVYLIDSNYASNTS